MASSTTSTPRPLISLRIDPASLDRGVSWFPAIRMTGAAGSSRRRRESWLNASMMERLVGRTAWNRSPAITTASTSRAMTASIARRKDAATSASRWLVPSGARRWNWRKPRWASARWAILTASYRVCAPSPTLSARMPRISRTRAAVVVALLFAIVPRVAPGQAPAPADSAARTDSLAAGAASSTSVSRTPPATAASPSAAAPSSSSASPMIG